MSKEFTTEEYIEYAVLDDNLCLRISKCYADALFYGCPVYKRIITIVYEKV